MNILMKTQYLLKTSLLAGVCALAMGFATSACGQTILVDFGNNGTNGNITTSPDLNGKYWNNSYNGGYSITNMVTTVNGASTIDLAYTTAVATNSSSLAVGGAPSPFNIGTAYEDAIFTTATTLGTGITFRLSQLDPTKTYTFALFGSRSATDSRTTNFSITGSTTATATLQTSGTNLGGVGINYNNSTARVISGIAPNGSNQIDVTFFASAGDLNDFAYLNAMEITVIPEPSTWALLAFSLTTVMVLRRRRQA